MTDFPKHEAGSLAVAARRVLGASAEELGFAMAELRKALDEYDRCIVALTHEQWLAHLNTVPK